MLRLLPVAAVVLASACSLVLDEPAPFVESRRDAAIVDMAPVLPDLAVEDAFVPRGRTDMAPAEPDAGPPDMAPADAEPAGDAQPGDAQPDAEQPA